MRRVCECEVESSLCDEQADLKALRDGYGSRVSSSTREAVRLLKSFLRLGEEPTSSVTKGLNAKRVWQHELKPASLDIGKLIVR